MMEQGIIPVEAFQTALLQMDRIGAARLFESCCQEHESLAALEEMTMKALENIGADWENGILSLSQVYMSGVICEELIEQYMAGKKTDYKTTPKMAIAVLQDYHALGKRIVTSVLRAGGYDLLDMGYGLSPEEIAEKTIAEKIDILLISVLMLPSALQVRKVVDLLREQGSKAKIIVGGAPFRLDPSLWQKVGADAAGKNGSDVLKIIDNLTGGGQSV